MSKRESKKHSAEEGVGRAPSSKEGGRRAAAAGDARAAQQQLVEPREDRAPPSTKDQLRKALNMTTETEELGGETLTELQRQREQLERTQRKVDDVDAHVEHGNWLLKGMKSWFGLRGKAPKTPKAVVEERSAARKGGDDSKARSSGAAGAGGRGAGSAGVSEEAGAAAPPAAGAGRGAGVSQSQAQARRDPRHAEEDDLLDAISSSLVRVKAHAQDIGAEISGQEAILDGLAGSLDKVDGKLKKATNVAKKLAS